MNELSPGKLKQKIEEIKERERKIKQLWYRVDHGNKEDRESALQELFKIDGIYIKSQNLRVIVR